MTVTSSPRPKPRPLAPMTSPRPMPNPYRDTMSPASIADRTTRPLKKGGKISEYSGKETYPSLKAMKAHEKAESPAKERAEKKTAKKVRGTGAAIKGTSFSKNG